MDRLHPREEYSARLDALKHIEERQSQRDRFFIRAKLAVGFVVVALIIWLAKYHSAQIAYVFLPIAIFIVLFILHERTLRTFRRCIRLRRFYEQGMVRLEDRWAGTGQQGESFIDPEHPYARDLDLFGKGGLFELLCTARTRAGEATLAQWLLTHAPVAEITERQAAIQDLAPRLDFRERLALAGDDVRIGVHPDALIAWSESTSRLSPHRLLRVAAPVLALCWVFSITGWLLWGWGIFAGCMSVLNLGLTYFSRGKVDHAIAEIDTAAHDLGILASVLREIEQEPFQSEKLIRLKSSLQCDHICPSEAIHRLSKRVDWLDQHENWFVKLLDLFIFWSPQWVLAIEAWREHFGASVRHWLEVTGEVEALASLAAYAYEHPENTFPVFVENGPYLHAEGMAHPLLPRGRAVANDLQLDKNLQLMIISGPNMAGKSTFIRSIGINAVLAQAGAPVCAGQFTLSPLAVAASICILDSLQGGLSRFYAEITRLRKIDELSRGEAPVLFLLDELLSGTNSHDRRVGTESFVRSLLARGAIGLITTHDLALAEITETLDGSAANFHFADSLKDGKLHFDYKLAPGIVQTTNALKLMRSIGLEV